MSKTCLLLIFYIQTSNCNLNCFDLRISLINTVSVTFNCPMVLIMRIQSSPHTSTVDTTHTLQPPISAQYYNHNDMYRQFPAPVCRIKRSADLRTNTKEVPRSSAGAILGSGRRITAYKELPDPVQLTIIMMTL